MDFDLDAYRPHILDILYTQRDALPWSGPLEAVEITTLGVGESNLMLHLALAGQPPLTMRLAYRENLAAAHLSQEYHLLQQLPEGLGPQPFVLDTSRQILPYPFAILSFVPGTPLVEYSEAILCVHATRLARMHQQEAATWTTWERQQSSDPFDFSQMFQKSVAHWRSLSPQFFEEEPLLRLVPRLADYFRKHNSLFTSLTRFPLIHGDLCACNILVHEGDVRYIDWEYARYGDGALDLAQLIWDIDNLPWQIKLTEQQFATFLQTYLKLRLDETLEERYAAWSVYIKFVDHITHRRTAERDHAIRAFPREDYQTVVQHLLDSLAGQFL